METTAAVVGSSFTSDLKMCLNSVKGADLKMSRLHCPVGVLFNKQSMSRGDDKMREQRDEGRIRFFLGGKW